MQECLDLAHTRTCSMLPPACSMPERATSEKAWALNLSGFVSCPLPSTCQQSDE